MTNEIVNKIIEELAMASGPVPLARLGGEHAALVAYGNLAKNLPADSPWLAATRTSHSLNWPL